MRRRPQRAGRIEKVAVGLDVDDDALLVAMPQRQAHRDADPGADRRGAAAADQPIGLVHGPEQIGIASCRASACQYVWISVAAASLKNKNTLRYIQYRKYIY